jgi:hypothetical protein
MQMVALAAGVGARTKIHFLDTPLAVCIERLERRNAGLPRFNFLIGPEMLEGFVQLFERPSEDEGAGVVVVPDDERPTAAVRVHDEI